MTLDHAFSQFPLLRTKRFLLRQLRLTDAQALFDIFSNPEVVQFIGRITHQSLKDSETLIQSLQSRYERREALRWAITDIGGNDTVIGTCSFHHFDPGSRRVEAGYNLHRAHWVKGIIAEAMTAVLDYGFTDLDLHRIEAVIEEGNTRSKNLLLKLGFTYEGNLRQRYRINDRFEDEHYYGLLQSEWLARASETTQNSSQ